MNSLPTNEKYVMFLNATYFKKRIFKSIYKNIIKRLENKGIVLFNINDAVEEIKRRHKNTQKHKTKITFDDNYFPNVNTLYINLFAGRYYNDNIYNKKKIEKEREMLFLLAGKLGVKQICYKTDVVETTITKMNAGIKTRGTLSTNFTKTVQKTEGIKGEEYYINRGAPVYLKYDNLQEVEKNIEEKMHSNIFDYKFYKNSPKLENFVYKRYEFKMDKLAYTIETEDISDISFAVKACFMDYGIDISFDKNVIYNENVHYKLEFFSDDELKKEFGKRKRDYLDKFYSIREYYDLIEDKDKAVHLITEYVMEFANNYHYIIKGDMSDLYQHKSHNFSKHIQDYIKYSQPGTFEGLCHSFQSTSQIKNWINKEFLNDNMEIISEMNISNNKEPKDIDLKYDKASVILPYEKKNNLQSTLELIARGNDDSDFEKDAELEQIINNCGINRSNSSLSFEEDPYINSYMKKRSNIPILPPPLPPRMNEPVILSEPINNLENQMTNDSYEHYLTTCTNDSAEENIRIEMEQAKLAMEEAERIMAEQRAMEEEHVRLAMEEHNRIEEERINEMVLKSFEYAMKQEEQMRLKHIKEHEEELLAKLDEIKYRPPIIPSSSVTSINSILNNDIELDKELGLEHPPYPPPPPPNSSDV